jgi:hypothetical protein
MKYSFQSLTKNDPIRGRDPNHKDLVWVQSKEYRCLAYLDDARKWINFYTGKKLTGFVKIIR